MSNKIFTKALLLAPLAAILINPSVASAKEKPNNIFITRQEVIVAKKVKYEEEKEAFLGEKAVKYKGKWGFIDDTGKMLTTFKYDDVWINEKNYREGAVIVAVKRNNKWGFIGEEGKEEVSPRYDEIKEVMNICVKVKKDGRWGLVATNGDIIVPFKYDDIEQFDGGFTAKVVLNGKKGVVDFKKEIISPIYDEINDILITPYQVKLGNKWGFISEEGKEVTSIKYDEVKAFFQGLAAVKKDDKWGFINLKGEEVVQPKYDEAGSFSENRAKVKLNGKWGYIDATGEEVIIPKYDGVGNFNGGLAGVCINGRWGLIGKNGGVKGKIEFDSIFNGEGMALIRVNRDGGTGYINKAGNIVIPTKYDEVINYNDEAVVVRLKKKWGVYDSTGKIAVPIKYDLIDNVNVYHDDKKGVTTLYVNVTLKKKALFIRFEAKSKKSANGEYIYKKWKKAK